MADIAEPDFEMVVQLRYPSRDAVEAALVSGVRYESRDLTEGLLQMYEGDIFHIVFHADDHALPSV